MNLHLKNCKCSPQILTNNILHFALNFKTTVELTFSGQGYNGFTDITNQILRNFGPVCWLYCIKLHVCYNRVTFITNKYRWSRRFRYFRAPDQPFLFVDFEKLFVITECSLPTEFVTNRVRYNRVRFNRVRYNRGRYNRVWLYIKLLSNFCRSQKRSKKKREKNSKRRAVSLKDIF